MFTLKNKKVKKTCQNMLHFAHVTLGLKGTKLDKMIIQPSVDLFTNMSKYK